MKKSASAPPPVSVRFFTGAQADGGEPGDEGSGGGDKAMSSSEPSEDPPAEDAAPQSGSVEVTGGPQQGPAETAGDPSAPVPPPRRHSVRSRAEEWRDALPDLSPVKELVSRLGKSRSSSVDSVPAVLSSQTTPSPSPSSVSTPAVSQQEQRRTSSTTDGGDTWSRLNELRDKITKTVEDKISDLRSERSGSARGGGTPSAPSPPSSTLQDFDVVSEAEIMDAIRDSPPPSPSPTLDDPAHCPDVSFVNVPTPVSAPSPSSGSPPAASTVSPTSKREFRLTSIRPKIYERLQRHVGRGAGVTTPPSGGQPPESVSLSALQNKYLEEVEVEDAQEALETIPVSPATDGAAVPPPEVGAPVAGSGASNQPGRGERVWSLYSLMPRLLDWRLIVGVSAVLLAIPIPSFLSGFLLGALLAAAATGGVFWLLRPPARCGRQQMALVGLRPPPLLRAAAPEHHLSSSSRMYKGWMHELTTGPYKPDIHLNTVPVFVRLEGTMLRISHPKGHVSKRAQWDEQIPNMTFVQQRIYDIAGCTVELLPRGLHHVKTWNRRYPICVRLDKCQRVTHTSSVSSTTAAGSGSTASRTQAVAPADNASLSPERTQTDVSESAGGQEADEGQATEATSGGAETDKHILLFARADREKEDWYRRLKRATRCPPERPASPGAGAGAGRSSSLPPPDSEADAASAPPPRRLDFDYYMAKVLSCVVPESGSRPPTPTSEPASPSHHQQNSAHHVTWFNALIGRLAFDMLQDRQWAEFVEARVQKKLSRIRLPYFIEELRVTSCDLGWALPRITAVTPPSSDERGLWVDMSFVYEGGASVTLSTKVKLTKLGKVDKEQGWQPGGSPGQQEVSSSSSGTDSRQQQQQQQSDSRVDVSQQYYREGDESPAESSSDEDDTEVSAQTDSVGVPVASSKVGKRLLKVVDKVTTSRYFQQATQNRYVKRKMEEISNTPLELSVNLKHLQGVLAVNIPRPPTDRVWYGFRGEPVIVLSAQPRLGTRNVTITHVTDWIENKLVLEVQKLLILPNMDDLIVPVMNPSSSGDP